MRLVRAAQGSPHRLPVTCYTIVHMTKLLLEVLRKVGELPAERQDDAAQVLLAMLENDASPYGLSDDQFRQVEMAIDDVERGVLAPERSVKEVLNRPWA